jgi:hypothetical protein
MAKEESISDKILRKFKEKMNKMDALNQIVTVLLKEDDTRQLGFKPYATLVEAGQWKKYNNDYSTRLDRRPDTQGGLQLHIRNNHSGTQWAYRGPQRSEPTRFDSATTKMVQKIIRDTFKLDPSVKIEAQFISTDETTGNLICEASIEG